uniref:Uncharacterized protein n=1 Tax=Romanomermis culicivorax TaxID=13658 RepID=A0A915JKS2_ROMCU
MNSCAVTSTTAPYHYQQRCENLLNIEQDANLHMLPLMPMLQPPIDENILKTGRGQKKFFVVRQDGYNSPARIDRYNSFKHFQAGSKADFSVMFKDVFSVNKTIYLCKTCDVRTCDIRNSVVGGLASMEICFEKSQRCGKRALKNINTNA